MRIGQDLGASRALRLVRGLSGVLLACAVGSSVANGRPLAPEEVRARLSLGHDSNLLDVSDVERGAFEQGDPRTFFVVDRMSDQFLEGEIEARWGPPGLSTGPPFLRLGWERRQYLHNPIRSEDRLMMGLRARAGAGTRLDLVGTYRPQVYARHRFDRDAMPGEPQFRPEAYRRWDLDLEVRRDVGPSTTVSALLEGSGRRYEAPFEERDRGSFGGGGEIARSLGGRVELRAGALYRATWTRNEPWDPDDRSHRIWRATSGIEARGLLFLKALSLDLEIEWRRFTSTNPDDQDHFGRRDWGGEVDFEVVHRLAGPLDWVSRATRRWRSSDFPETVIDEEGVFDEAVFQTGVAWAWERR